MSKISVVIVTFNSERTIGECLESVIKYSSESEIIVVDNGSKDSTVKVVQGFAGKVKLIETGKNLGFSKGNNLGAKEAGSEFLVFLNPDTRLLQKDSLLKLQDILENYHEYGLIGPQLLWPDGKVQLKTRNLPTIWGAFKEYILGIKGAYDFYEPGCRSLCEVESINGACMFIRKDLFWKAGGFDEKYFMYFEDLELCRVIRKLGYKVGFLPEVAIEHAEGISGTNQKTGDFIRDSARKYHGTLPYYLIELILTPQRIFNKFKNVVGGK